MPNPATPTRSCPSWKPRSWAISRSARMSIPWTGSSFPVDQMMKLVEKEVHDPNPDLRGNIILLHDSGGDRTQTLKLLPILIDRMRAEGYSFVPVSQLGGFTRDQVMPRLPLTVRLYADRMVFLTLSYHRPVPLLLFHRRHHPGRGAAVDPVRPGAAQSPHRPWQARADRGPFGRNRIGADPGL